MKKPLDEFDRITLEVTRPDGTKYELGFFEPSKVDATMVRAIEAGLKADGYEVEIIGTKRVRITVA